MNYFTKRRLAFWGIVVLVIVNISSLATVWFQQHRRPEPPPRDMPPPPGANQFLKRELGLNDAQAEQFAKLQRQHFERARALQNAIGELKHELFGELSSPVPDTVKVERLADEIGARQSDLEKITFHHFLDLKNLCTVEQRKKLDVLFHELLRGMAPHHKPPPPPDGGPRPPRDWQRP